MVKEERQVFRLKVDCRKSFERMIASAHFDKYRDEVTAEHFPITSTSKGIVEFEACYFHFNRSTTSEDAVEEIEQDDKNNPWLPAKIEHMLSHGATFRDEQLKFPIVGLGSVANIDGKCLVPCLDNFSNRTNDLLRCLRPLRWDCVWFLPVRLLAVRRVSGF